MKSSSLSAAVFPNLHFQMFHFHLFLFILVLIFIFPNVNIAREV